MLKSKLRKTGVYLHLRTRSLENACYSSTTCPTLSTLFFAKCARLPSGGAIILAPFCTILFNLLYTGGCENTLFAGKNFYSADGKTPGFAVGGRAKAAANFRADRQQRRDFSARFRTAASSGSRAHPPPFPSASDACFRMFFTLFSPLLYIEQVSRRTDVFANADASCGGKGRTGVSAQFKTLHGREAQARRRQSENLTFPKRRKPHGFACLVLVLFLSTRCSGCGMFHVKHLGACNAGIRA